MIWKHGGIEQALPHIISEYTGRSMSYSGVTNYLKVHGYKIVFGPYLIDNAGNLIDTETLIKG
tara:strand:+ start:3600 stop:3788 length:189 start_codon:yes stop_codon:yes gene_type:complete